MNLGHFENPARILWRRQNPRSVHKALRNSLMRDILAASTLRWPLETHPSSSSLWLQLVPRLHESLQRSPAHTPVELSAKSIICRAGRLLTAPVTSEWGTEQQDFGRKKRILFSQREKTTNSSLSRKKKMTDPALFPPLAVHQKIGRSEPLGKMLPCLQITTKPRTADEQRLANFLGSSVWMARLHLFSKFQNGVSATA